MLSGISCLMKIQLILKIIHTHPLPPLISHPFLNIAPLKSRPLLISTAFTTLQEELVVETFPINSISVILDRTKQFPKLTYAVYNSVARSHIDAEQWVVCALDLYVWIIMCIQLVGSPVVTLIRYTC